MPLPESFIQELKMRNEIGDVASAYVNLKRRGRNLVGLCPFHHEKTPSFNIYPENGSFFCFGCETGGDVITFIRKIENLDYMEAVRFLAQRSGMRVPEENVDDSMSRLRQKIYEINREAARFYHGVLRSPGGKPGMDYLRSRKMPAKMITHFGLGYAPDARFELVNHLRKAGYSDEQMIAANVAVRTRNGHAMDRFYGRVMFPIIDLRGNVIAFGGRILTDQKPKYLNTNETPVFHKSANLYAMNFAKNFCAERLILAEGYMDVIALHGAGFENAVATLGTALTSEQASLMARYTKEVAVCYDSDEAGRRAASRAIPILRSAGLIVKVITVPGNKDPDEFIKANGEDGPIRFKKLLDSSGTDIDYALQKLKAQYGEETESGKFEYLREAVTVLAGIENRLERELYAARISGETGVDKHTILSQAESRMKKLQAARSRRGESYRDMQRSMVQDRTNPEKPGNLRAARAEEAAIGYLFANPDEAEYWEEKLPPSLFATEFNRRIYSLVLRKIKAVGTVNLTDFSESLSETEMSAAARILARYHEFPIQREDMENYRKLLLEEREDKRIQQADGDALKDYLEQLRKSKK